MKTETKEIINTMFALINKILLGEKKKIFTFRDLKLYPSETHLILSIHLDGNTNATWIAERLGVTKGAVSQILTRLEKKGIVQKIKDPYKKNEITIEFTKLGADVLSHCLQSLTDFHNQYDNYLSTLNANDHTVINKFLKKALVITDNIVTSQ